jgi:hypothetical protein
MGQVHRSFNLGAFLGVRASVHQESRSWARRFGEFPLFVDRVRAISLYRNRLVGLRGSGRLVGLAFDNLGIVCACGRR